MSVDIKHQSYGGDMAVNNLANCLPVTLKYEGGFTDDPRDGGNWTGGTRGKGVLKGTNMGIAASSHPNLDIKNLSKPQVEAIYNQDYWGKAGCESLPVGLDLEHFDATVNSGLGHSAGWLKTALKAATAVNRIHAYSDARLTSMHSFSAWVWAGKGWAARVAAVEAAAIKMATAGAPVAASQIIATKGAAVAVKGKVTKAASYASAGAGSAATTALAHSHPYVAGGVFLSAVLSTLWSSFHSSVSGARAATLANAAVS